MFELPASQSTQSLCRGSHPALLLFCALFVVRRVGPYRLRIIHIIRQNGESFSDIVITVVSCSHWKENLAKETVFMVTNKRNKRPIVEGSAGLQDVNKPSAVYRLLIFSFCSTYCCVFTTHGHTSWFKSTILIKIYDV